VITQQNNVKLNSSINCVKFLSSTCRTLTREGGRD